MNQASMDHQVLGEAVARAVGDRVVTALVLTTHDLDPEFFEQEILPAFIGIQAVHSSPRVRALQVGTEMREREIAVDVFFESRALSAEEGAAHLGWNRIPMTGNHGGVFHPKVAMLVCRDEAREEDGIVVVTGSANLTRGGWWTNVECVDVTEIAQDERHNYVNGLKIFAKRLQAQRGKVSPGSAAPALEALRSLLETMAGYHQVTQDGRLRPAFLPGGTDFIADLESLFGARLRGCNLEVISPFLDEAPDSVVRALTAMRDRLGLKSIRLALPIRAERTTVTEALYEALNELPFVEWASLPSIYTRSSTASDALPRSVHAKVYRFWRRGSASMDAIDVRVMGSHNLTTAAHSGNLNWESSVVHEEARPQGQWFLEAGLPAPQFFEDEDPDAESEARAAVVPVTIRFDWKTGRASATWGVRSAPQTVALSQNGREIHRVAFAGQRIVDLPAGANRELRDALQRSCVMRAEWGEGPWGYLLVQELNHHLKPDPLTYLELTAAEILALWSIPGLRERIERYGRSRDRGTRRGEDLDDQPKVAPSSMFERFAGVFHAFASLRRKVCDHMEKGEDRKAAAALYAAHLGSPINLLKVVRGDIEDPDRESDLELAYVTYAQATLLDSWATRTYPDLARECGVLRKELKTELGFGAVIRDLLLERSDDREAMAQFMTWFDQEFKKEVTG